MVLRGAYPKTVMAEQVLSLSRNCNNLPLLRRADAKKVHLYRSANYTLAIGEELPSPLFARAKNGVLFR
jgi:hypothetical protein